MALFDLAMLGTCCLRASMSQPTTAKLMGACAFCPRNVGDSSLGHFSVGTTMPRMMMFWQKMKTSSVGIAATTSDAKETPMFEYCWSW